MIGVVADDTTGANDIGNMFSKNNYAVKILPYNEKLHDNQDIDVLILDTDSRLDSESESYKKVYQATKKLQDVHCSFFYKKTCSVFRGNVGKEFDAMLDALNEEFMVVTLGFPKNGRKTINGIHMVNGEKLEHTAFANDPVHPMKQSNLVDILQNQTDRKVDMVPLEIVRSGLTALKKEINTKRNQSQYCIIDTETQQDLTISAEALLRCSAVGGGSSAVAEEIPKFLTAMNSAHPLKRIDFKDDKGVLVVSGSLTPQTKEQTSYFASLRKTVIVLDPRKLFSPEVREAEIKKTTEKVQHFIAQGEDVLVMPQDDEEAVAETKSIGTSYNMEELAISKIVSSALAEVTNHVVVQENIKKLIVAGGDTSGTVCRKLGIKGNYVLKEIDTGLPSGLAIGREMLIVLKSGSFGKEEFLEQAVQHLKQLST